MITRLISGGQTGVERAALDAAIAAGVSIGGADLLHVPIAQLTPNPEQR